MQKKNKQFRGEIFESPLFNRLAVRMFELIWFFGNLSPLMFLLYLFLITLVVSLLKDTLNLK